MTIAPESQRPAPQPESTAPIVVAVEPILQGAKYDFVRIRARAGARSFEREVVRHPGAVVVVPILDDGRVVLIRNYRLALAADGGQGQWLWECCAGTVERSRGLGGQFLGGELPEVCAARELVEETGYRADSLCPLGSFWTTPGLTNERMHAFVATGLSPVGQSLEQDEFIRVEAFPPADVRRMIDRGDLCDAKSMLAYLMAVGKGYIREC
jgi:ADP-ribose pyrophosphatase